MHCAVGLDTLHKFDPVSRQTIRVVTRPDDYYSQLLQMARLMMCVHMFTEPLLPSSPLRVENSLGIVEDYSLIFTECSSPPLDLITLVARCAMPERLVGTHSCSGAAQPALYLSLN